MKLSRNILYLSILLFLASCNKNNDTNEYFWNTKLGETYALKNGEEWTATQSYYSYSKNKNLINLSFYRTNEFNEPRESLSFFNIPFKTGTYKISKNIANKEDSLQYALYLLLVADGDAIENFYDIDEDSPYHNKLTILEIKEIGDFYTIIGEFQIKLHVAFENLSTSGNPDTIIFEKAEFEVARLY